MFYCVCAILYMALFFAAPANAEWQDAEVSLDLDTVLPFDTEVSILGRDPACETSPEECIPGLVELPLFDEFGQKEVNLFDIVKVTATLEVTDAMPRPLQIQIVFGGLGYQTAPRTWTLREAKTYSTSAYFLVGSTGTKTIGARAQVRWQGQAKLIENIILDEVDVEP